MKLPEQWLDMVILMLPPKINRLHNSAQAVVYVKGSREDRTVMNYSCQALR